MNQRNDLLCKVLILGESKVGKSSILSRFTEKTFTENLPPTLGIDYKIMRISIQGTDVKMQIWDTAGQERFRSITESFYKGCQGVLLVFDLTDPETFNKIKNWLVNIAEKAGSGVLVVLLGNKCDLKDKKDVILVPDEQIQALVNETHIKYFETSAKEDINVSEAFMYAARVITEGSREVKVPVNDDLRIGKRKEKEEGKCCK